MRMKAQLSFSDWNFIAALCLVVIVVNFSYYRLLIQNHKTNFNQTWNEALWDSSLFKWRDTPFFKGRWLIKIVRMFWKILLQNQLGNLLQSWNKTPFPSWREFTYFKIKSKPFQGYICQNTLTLYRILSRNTWSFQANLGEMKSKLAQIKDHIWRIWSLFEWERIWNVR